MSLPFRRPSPEHSARRRREDARALVRPLPKEALMKNSSNDTSVNNTNNSKNSNNSNNSNSSSASVSM